MIPTFAQRRLAAYMPAVLALVAIALLSFGLATHPISVKGLSVLSLSLFSVASLAILIPSGVQVFSWIGTLWENQGLVWKTPLLWMVGFIPLFDRQHN